MSKYRNEGPARTMLHQAAMDALKLTGARKVIIDFTSYTDPVRGPGCDGTIQFIGDDEIAAAAKTQAEEKASEQAKADD